MSITSEEVQSFNIAKQYLLSSEQQRISSSSSSISDDDIERNLEEENSRTTNTTKKTTSKLPVLHETIQYDNKFRLLTILSSLVIILILIITFLFGMVTSTMMMQQQQQQRHQNPFLFTTSSNENHDNDDYRLERAYLVTMHIPNYDVDKVMKAIYDEVQLVYGSYDHVAYFDAPGIEQYQPLEDSVAARVGSQEEQEQDYLTKEPTTRVHFSIPQGDEDLLKRALDVAYYEHSYEEPVFFISEVWRTRSNNQIMNNSPDAIDSNPNKWWNRDWEN